jgi:Zn finger protein HypA/HybF involved in hydrogenase expression
MSEEPQLPPIPSITDDWDRKKSFVERKHSVLKCGACQADYTRIFKPGDFVFKELSDEECEKCHSRKLAVIEIYSEWINPKKEKK